MRKIVVTYSGAAYNATTKLIVERSMDMGATDVWCFDDKWIRTTPFYANNIHMWEHPGHKGRKFGDGWYCWKAYTILHAMKHMAAGDLKHPEEGDVICWLDGDCYPISDFSMLFDACIRERGFFCFAAEGCSDQQWVKRDVWEAVFPEALSPTLGCPMEQWQHATARFMLFQKGRAGVATFLESWQKFNVQKWLATRDPSIGGPEFPGFEENRGDQSIFSLLTHQYGLPLHREADAFGNNSDRDRDLYPNQLFEQLYCQGNRADLSGSKYRRGPGI
jgi:hypothetical protein